MLSELAKEFQGKVSFAGVSTFETDQGDVEPFVKAMGEHMDYSVAMDELSASGTGFMAENWMRGADGRLSLPTAFVVKDGKIAWIGHPFVLDQVLYKVVAGTFDARSFSETAAMHEFSQAWQRSPIAQQLNTISELESAGKYAEALKHLDAMENLDPKGSLLDPKAFAMTFRPVYNALLRDFPSMAKTAQEAIAHYKDDPFFLDDLARNLSDPRLKVPKEALHLAIQAACRAADATDRKMPAFLDTLAWAYFRNAEKDKAAATEKEAISISRGKPRSTYENALKTFQAGKVR